MGDISLSSSAVLAVTGLLAALCGALGVVWRQSQSRERELTDAIIRGKDSQILREQELTNKLLPAVEENTRTLQRVAELMQAISQERPSSPGRSERTR